MAFDELRNQPILLFPNPKDEVRFADEDHVWVNGKQFISLRRVGEMVKEKRMTNADRIRAMTDEELAKHFSIYCWSDNWCGHHRDCEACWLDWLKQEAKESPSD